MPAECAMVLAKFTPVDAMRSPKVTAIATATKLMPPDNAEDPALQMTITMVFAMILTRV